MRDLQLANVAAQQKNRLVNGLPVATFTKGAPNRVQVLHHFGFRLNSKGANVASAIAGLSHEGRMVEIDTNKLWSKAAVKLPSTKTMILDCDPDDPTAIAADPTRLEETRACRSFFIDADSFPDFLFPLPAPPYAGFLAGETQDRWFWVS